MTRESIHMAEDRSEILFVENLEIGIEQRPLLSVDELRLTAGQIVALHGPSGCGKTTLLRTLAGLIDPLAGSVRLGGRTAQELGWPRFRRRVPLVAQQPVLLDGSVGANLRRPFEYRTALGKSYDSDAAMDMLEAVGLPRAIVDKRARSLSVGEQQRVCLVRALLIGPTVLLLDEPMSALDGDAAGQVEELLLETCRERRLAVLAATHQTERAQRWCDAVIELGQPSGGRG